ncbi:hypothetical protein Pcinc_032649 [Petrolisthes cinctipes]|uniref:Uncharacterized protein n=1 Tax=Petrolisthes cinctipes TaxID=88211 RepID=A0AAE1K2P0_PETCI|nr:hypothetical protein Pcinc_032649 [Petrolisthes cinctipes]
MTANCCALPLVPSTRTPLFQDPTQPGPHSSRTPLFQNSTLSGPHSSRTPLFQVCSSEDRWSDEVRGGHWLVISGQTRGDEEGAWVEGWRNGENEGRRGRSGDGDEEGARVEGGKNGEEEGEWREEKGM